MVCTPYMRLSRGRHRVVPGWRLPGLSARGAAVQAGPGGFAVTVDEPAQAPGDARSLSLPGRAASHPPTPGQFLKRQRPSLLLQWLLRDRSVLLGGRQGPRHAAWAAPAGTNHKAIRPWHFKPLPKRWREKLSRVQTVPKVKVPLGEEWESEGRPQEREPAVRMNLACAGQNDPCSWSPASRAWRPWAPARPAPIAGDVGGRSRRGRGGRGGWDVGTMHPRGMCLWVFLRSVETAWAPCVWPLCTGPGCRA